MIHPFESINLKNSASKQSDCNVRLEPKMTSFRFALVNDTLIRLQSRNRSPIYHQTTLARITHIAELVRSHEGDQDTLLVPSLAFVRCKNFDSGFVKEVAGEELDLLAVRCDDGEVFLLQTRCDHCGGELQLTMCAENGTYLCDDFSFPLILHEIAEPRIERGDQIGIDKDSLDSDCKDVTAQRAHSSLMSRCIQQSRFE